MKKDEELSVSLEDYLEVILDLQTEKTVARSKDIAAKMDIKRGSVTSMLKKLAEKELINYEPYGYVTLTRQGKTVALEIQRRHSIIKEFLTRVLRIEDEKADATACRMEHTMDKTTVDSLLNFINFIDSCPRAGSDWIQSFVDFCATKKQNKKKCKQCVKDNLIRVE